MPETIEPDDIDQDDIEPTMTDQHYGLRLAFPFLATITVKPADWFHFQNVAANNLNTCIVGHDARKDGMVIVYVACSSIGIRYGLEQGYGLI
jgi:hypothetical protein